MKLYGVIVADPPWPHTPTGFTMHGGIPSFKGWWVEGEMLSIDQLCQMHIPSAPDSLLFLWTPAGELPHALRVMQAWEFSYKSCLVWVKTRQDGGLILGGGIGWWIGMRHELVLFGTRGKPQRPQAKAIMSSVVGWPPVGGGGGKPEILQDRIDGSGIVGPYLEMFARRPRKGWDVFGNLPESITFE